MRAVPAPLLGAHVSISGGLANAIDRGEDLHAAAIQIFVKNANQWRSKPLQAEQVALFHHARARSSIQAVAAHGTYLVNLASPDARNRRKSRSTLLDELDRCELLSVPHLIVHPGAHLGEGVAAGVRRVAMSLDALHRQRPKAGVRILLENTAGQGTSLGRSLEELRAIRERTKESTRLGVCVDTCHAFAAGYDLGSRSGYDDFFGELDDGIGLASVGCLHLNDSQGDVGSQLDRHANLGAGKIPLQTFEWLLADPRFTSTPMILETPRGEDGEGHRRDLEILRSLLPPG